MRHFFKYRPRRRRNTGEEGILSALNPMALTASPVFAGVRPSNLVRILPVVGGAIANGMLRTWVANSGSMPNLLRKGIGNYLLGVVSAGVMGAVVGRFNYQMGQGVMMGGMAETGLGLFGDVYTNGVSALTPNLKGCEGIGCMGGYYDQPYQMGDFISPQMTQQAFAVPSQPTPYLPSGPVAGAPLSDFQADAVSAVLAQEHPL